MHADTAGPITEIRVLIVGDCRARLTPLVELLGARGCIVRCADSAAGALDWQQGAQPELAFVEASFAQASGFELCRSLVGDKRCGAISVALLVEQSEKKAAFEAGATFVLTLPWVSGEVLACLDAVASRHCLEQELAGSRAQLQAERELGLRINKETQQLRDELTALRESLEEQKKALHAGRLAQLSIDRTVDHAIWIGPDGRLLYVNEAICRDLEYSREEMLQMHVWEVAKMRPPSEFPENWNTLRRLGAMRFETVLFAKGGRTLPVEIRANFVVLQGQELNCAFATNITERKRAEEALKESEQRYRNLIANLPAGVIVYDQHGRILFSNAQAEKILGRSPSQFPDISSPDFESGVLAEDGTCVPLKELPVPKVLRTRSAVRNFVGAVTRSGSSELSWLLCSAFPFFTETGELDSVTMLLTDITDRKRLEGQLNQAQRMESLGLLAGGVAHDFNNLLTPILGYAELLLSDSRVSDIDEPLQTIRDAAERAKTLVRRLLAFSRTQMIELKVVDLGEIVRHFEPVLRRTLQENIGICVLVSPASGQIRADAAQIEQVLLNLAINAQDAMPAGGTLTIEVSNTQLEAIAGLGHEGAGAGPYVMLAVSDSGIGMDEKTKARVFDPFFTTKELGKGTGLGLSTVYGIVRQHGGAISVYSEPDHGTCFKVYFPQIFEPGVPVKAPSSDALLSGNETILVAEDDELVRNLVADSLRSLGYRVLCSVSVDEALAMMRRYGGAVDLLLTDVVMPKMNGRELYQKLQEIQPNLQVIYMSGYTTNVISHQGVLDHGANFIHKPFTRLALSIKIREVLAAR